jgi:hypothetical protein
MEPHKLSLQITLANPESTGSASAVFELIIETSSIVGMYHSSLLHNCFGAQSAQHSRWLSQFELGVQDADLGGKHKIPLYGILDWFIPLSSGVSVDGSDVVPFTKIPWDPLSI